MPGLSSRAVFCGTAITLTAKGSYRVNKRTANNNNTSKRHRYSFLRACLMQVLYFNVNISLFNALTSYKKVSKQTQRCSQRGWPGWPKPPPIPSKPQSPLRKKIIRQKQLILFTIYCIALHIKLHSDLQWRNALNYLMMLQAYKSINLSPPSIDAVIERFAITAAWKLNFLTWTYTCTGVHCTVQ